MVYTTDIFKYKYHKTDNWKDKSQIINTIVPGNQFPDITILPYEPSCSRDISCTTSGSFRPRPIKHWRKQLIPNKITGSSKTNINIINTPGGTTNTNYSSTSDCPSCDTENTTNLIKTYVPHNSLKSSPQYYQANTDDKFADTNLNNRIRCVACNPEALVIKSGIVGLNKKYYTNTNQYLQSRCRTYKQNQIISKISHNKYVDSNNRVIPASDSPLGSQVFNATTCYGDSDIVGCTIKTIYKPSNRTFGVQGAVSSSSRVARLKYNTITQNGASFNSVGGLAAANAGKYLGTTEAPFFIKSKYTKPCINPMCNFKPNNKIKMYSGIKNTNY